MPVTCTYTQARSGCRHEPEKHPLYQVLAQHLETFLQRTRTAEHQLPDHVERELRAYLKCGILAYGFVRYEPYRQFRYWPVCTIDAGCADGFKSHWLE